MTNNPDPSSAPPHPASADVVTQACVHIDAAAHQLEAAAGGDVFSPLLALAGQLALIRGGIAPRSAPPMAPKTASDPWPT